MKLFIIGNGFDRGHDLPTKYSDFRTFLDDEHWQFIMSFEERYSIYQTDTSDLHYQADAHNESRDNLLWNELETNLANIHLDRIIEDAVHMDLGLENENNILDTLEQHHSGEFRYIEQLATYLDEWVKTIDLDSARPRTTLINPDNEDIYINFNYTEVLETIYNIDPFDVIHIHGSIRQDDIDPVLGHGNREIIDRMIKERHEAKGQQDEKAMSILRTMENYFTETYKDISEYMPELDRLHDNDIDEIIVIGHSLSGVDIPYFKEIDLKTSNKARWKVYYYYDNNGTTQEKQMLERLLKCGIDRVRIDMFPYTDFYDLP